MQEKIYATVTLMQSERDFSNVKDLTDTMPDHLAFFTEKILNESVNRYNLEITKTFREITGSLYSSWTVEFNRIGMGKFVIKVNTDDRLNDKPIMYFYLIVDEMHEMFIGSYEYSYDILDILNNQITEISRRYFRRI